jgi:hypothetical protein
MWSMPDRRASGAFAPPDSIVTALALDAALDARARSDAAGLGSADDLLVLADAVRARPRQDRWDHIDLDQLEPVTLGPVRPIPVGFPLPAKRVRRGYRREAMTAAAAMAVLAAGLDMGLSAQGGVSIPAAASSAAVRMALVDDRVQLAPPASAVAGNDAADELTSLDCPTARGCFAVADAPDHAVVAVSTDGGRTWQRHGAPGNVTELSAIGCSSPEHCVAVGSAGGTAAIVSTTDGGRHWVNQSTPAAVTSLVSVSCPQIAHCWAVGQAGTAAAIVTTADGGRHWVSQSAPAATVSLASVSCGVVESCWAGGTARNGGIVLTTANGGRTWHRQVLAGSAPTRIVTVSCSTGAGCWAAGPDRTGAVDVFTRATGATMALATSPRTIGTGTAAIPLCPPGCGSSGNAVANQATRTIEGVTAAALSGRIAAGALTCPTALQCWDMSTSETGVSANSLELGRAASGVAG